MRRALVQLSNALAGHYWTVSPFVAALPLFARPPCVALEEGGAATGARWSGSVDDPARGRLELSGWLDAPSGARSLLVALHGLGGSSESFYLTRSVAEARARGWACLRLNMRGADGSGEDFYHAALTADLHAALASPRLAGFEDIFVVGYSLGGHIALCFAAEPRDSRVRAVAAVCAPLDLARSAWAIDRARSFVYRRHVLRRLVASYAAVARRRAVPSTLERVRRVRHLREWDACTVVPRYGFQSTADYYERASAARRLHALGIPALLVNTEHDPMVPAETVRPALVAAPAALDVRWLRAGGHVGFPLTVDLGEAAPRGLEPQVTAWLARAAPR